MEKRLKDFAPYQINKVVLAKAKSDVSFMHNGPAFHGEEVTDEVIDGPHSAVWDHAENRMHTEKAVLNIIIIYFLSNPKTSWCENKPAMRLGRGNSNTG